jgi:transposase
MQKSLDQMNVRLHRAVSDVDGVTGMAILKAIAGGERDPRKLAQLRDGRCKKTEEQIAEQLSGHWREDHLFSLQQGLKMYETIEQRIEDYNHEILRVVRQLERRDFKDQIPPKLKNAAKTKAIRKRGEEEIREGLFRMSGVDLTAIDGVGVDTIQVVLSEYGPDLSRFPTEHEFIQHIRLAPYKPNSGGKATKKRRPNTASTRVSAALRMAAVAVRHSQTALGAFYRAKARQKDGGVAAFATVRRIATYIYRFLRWGHAYVDEGAAAFDARYEQNRLRSLKTKAKQLGYAVVPIPNPPAQAGVTG